MDKKVILIILFFASIYLVSSTHIATTSTGASSYSKSQNENSLYNISISNPDIGQNANITQVSMTIPDSFIFELGSQGTDAISTDFTKTNTMLIWEDLENYLINGSETKYFWFKAEASLVGDYNLIITTLSGTGIDNSTIQVKITDCIPNWACSKWSSCTNFAQTRICADQDKCNNGTDKPIEFQSCSTVCAPNWTCTEWSECAGENKIRSCVDFNTCGDNLTKPIETQKCNICIPDWNCTQWSECTDSLQTRTCVDLNDSQFNEEESVNAKSCVIESGQKLFSITIVILVVIIIVNILFLTITLKENRQSK